VKHSFNRCSFTGIRRAGGIVSDGARRSLHGLGQDAPATWRDCFRRSETLLARSGAGCPSHLVGLFQTEQGAPCTDWGRMPRPLGGIVSDGARCSLHGLGQDAPAT
jgi:hypothetical protein